MLEVDLFGFRDLLPLVGGVLMPDDDKDDDADWADACLFLLDGFMASATELGFPVKTLNKSANIDCCELGSLPLLRLLALDTLLDPVMELLLRP